MKITIDTNTDSKEDIRKVMQILSHFTDKEIVSNEPVDTTNMMSMFDSAPTETSPPPDVSNFMSLMNRGEAEKKEETPKIQFF